MVECGTALKYSVLGTICLLEPKRYLSPFMSPLQYKTHISWGTVPNLCEEVKLGGRVFYRLIVLCSRYNLFAGT